LENVAQFKSLPIIVTYESDIIVTYGSDIHNFIIQWIINFEKIRKIFCTTQIGILTSSICITSQENNL